MTILHMICTFLTAPAALIRAFFEHILLKCMHIPVEDSGYFQKNELCGHVEHEPIRSLGRSFLFCCLPGLVLLVFGAAMAVSGGVQLFTLGVAPIRIETGTVSAMFIVSVILYYLGLCCLCQLFPLYEDALYLFEAYAASKNAAVKALLFVPVCLVRAGAFLARFGVFPLAAAAVTAYYIL